MKQLTNHEIINDESWESQRKAGRYHPALELSLHGWQATLGAGHGDELTIWGGDGVVVVISTNVWRHDYAGAQMFDAKDGDILEDSYAQGSWRVDEMFGERFFDLTERGQLRRVMAHLKNL